jgi:hypothetical protein
VTNEHQQYEDIADCLNPRLDNLSKRFPTAHSKLRRRVTSHAFDVLIVGDGVRHTMVFMGSSNI